MTMPNERTKAVTDTRDFLETIAGSESAVDFRLVRTLAIQLLRHFPDDSVLSLSASLLPGVWAQPKGDVSKTTDAVGLERQ
ncbi:hypothetical protein CA602_21670 [Paraburkholderia hospita]|nr:hypothetical protein CA602_21670 [Paraburkholderia hospita]